MNLEAETTLTPFVGSDLEASFSDPETKSKHRRATPVHPKLPKKGLFDHLISSIALDSDLTRTRQSTVKRHQASQPRMSQFTEQFYCQCCRCLLEVPVSAYSVKEACTHARYRCVYPGCFDRNLATYTYEDIETHLRTCKYRIVPKLLEFITEKGKFTDD